MKKVVLNGLNIFYQEKGRGEPVLFLHGWEKSAKVFLPVQKSLAKDFLAVALDLPGFGQSSLPPTTWGVSEYAELVKEFVQKMGWRKLSLVGHSFGGRIALELAIDSPKIVNRLVVTGVPVLRKKGLKRAVFLILAKILKLIFFIPPLFFFRAWLRKAFYRLVGEGDYLKTQGLKKKIFRKVIAHKQAQRLEKIKAPTLIVWGQQDRFIPIENAHFLKDKIKKSELVVVKGASHKLPYEEPKEFAKALAAFLKG